MVRNRLWTLKRFADEFNAREKERVRMTVLGLSNHLEEGIAREKEYGSNKFMSGTEPMSEFS